MTCPPGFNRAMNPPVKGERGREKGESPDLRQKRNRSPFCLLPSPLSAVNYTARMLPSFFDSMVELITKTSTDLPPDVRAAMRTALAAEDATSRAGQAMTI